MYIYLHENHKIHQMYVHIPVPWILGNDDSDAFYHDFFWEIYVHLPWILYGFLGKNRRWIDANSFTLKEPTLGQDLR